MSDPARTSNLSDGTNRVHYRTDSLRFYAKTTGLPRTLFTPAGSATLVLISCGGTFNAVTRSYRSNVVVTATRS